MNSRSVSPTCSSNRAQCSGVILSMPLRRNELDDVDGLDTGLEEGMVVHHAAPVCRTSPMSQAFGDGQIASTRSGACSSEVRSMSRRKTSSLMGRADARVGLAIAADQIEQNHLRRPGTAAGQLAAR